MVEYGARDILQAHFEGPFSEIIEMISLIAWCLFGSQ